MSDYRTDFQIGATVATMDRLIHRGIPNPDRWTFTPYSVVNIRGDGRSVGDGYPSATWTWALLSQFQYENILALYSSDADASVEVGIRTPTERGRVIDTEDYTAIMHRPLGGEEKTVIQDSRTPVWEEVTVRFSKLRP